MNKIIEGTIASGLGEGTLFMSMEHYRKEIKSKLGFDAYPGTLNIRVKESDFNLLKIIAPLRIAGYKSSNKVFGGASCYRAKIKNINGFIIVPDFTKHQQDIIEFIAPIHVKSELKLSNGDKVKIELK